MISTRSLRAAALDKSRLGNRYARLVVSRLVRFGMRTEADWQAYNRGEIAPDGGVPRKPTPPPTLEDVDETIQWCQRSIEYHTDALVRLREIRARIAMGEAWR